MLVCGGGGMGDNVSRHIMIYSAGLILSFTFIVGCWCCRTRAGSLVLDPFGGVASYNVNLGGGGGSW